MYSIAKGQVDCLYRLVKRRSGQKLATPVFAENDSAWDLVEGNYLRSNSIAHVMERQCGWALVEFSIRSFGTFNNNLVVTKMRNPCSGMTGKRIMVQVAKGFSHDLPILQFRCQQDKRYREHYL